MKQSEVCSNGQNKGTLEKMSGKFGGNGLKDNRWKQVWKRHRKCKKIRKMEKRGRPQKVHRISVKGY